MILQPTNVLTTILRVISYFWHVFTCFDVRCHKDTCYIKIQKRQLSVVRGFVVLYILYFCVHIYSITCYYTYCRFVYIVRKQIIFNSHSIHNTKKIRTMTSNSPLLPRFRVVSCAATGICLIRNCRLRKCYYHAPILFFMSLLLYNWQFTKV